MSFSAAAVRAEVPILAATGLHYLDNGATGQMPRAVLDAVATHETTSRANVLRGVHRLAEAATEAYAQAREDVASYLNVANPDEVIFTSGTTGAINLVAHSFGDQLEAGDEVVISVLEHHSNIVPWQLLKARRGIVLKALPATAEGRIDVSALDCVITRKTRLVALTHVSNVTGAVTDVSAVVAAARAVGAVVLLDGAQRVPHGPVDLAALGVDFYAFSGHKMFAPNGIGCLWGRMDLLDAMPPFLGGGEMIRTVSLEHTEFADVPHRFEAGTPPIAQAVGLGAAARWLGGQDWPAIAAHEMRLTGKLLDGLSTMPKAKLFGPSGLQARAPVVSFDVPGAHPHDICQMLDADGVALRGGHHCAQPLMEAFDLAGTTRATIALYNDDSDIDALLTGLDKAIGRLT
jgi:cysteine desulfurase / selenocysteine lyase